MAGAEREFSVPWPAPFGIEDVVVNCYGIRRVGPEKLCVFNARVLLLRDFNPLSQHQHFPGNCWPDALDDGLAPIYGDASPVKPRGGMVHAEDCKSFNSGRGLQLPRHHSLAGLPVRPRSRPIAPAQLVTCDSRRPASSGASAMPSSAKRNMSSKSSSRSKMTPPTLIASTSLSPFGAK